MVYIDVYLSQTNWNPAQNSILVSSVRSSVLTMPKICLLWDPICLFPAVDVLLVHTWYLSAEQIFSCGAILLHMKICACFVEEKLLSLKSNFAPPHEYFCLSCGEKLPHMSRNFALHLYHHDLCCLRQIRFVLIYAVLTKNRFCRDLRAFVWSKK